MTTAPVIELPPPAGHGDVLARLQEARQLLVGIPGDLAGVMSDDLAALAAEAAAVAAAADAAQAAVVLEASSRGVIATSDHPRPQRWVEQSCREGGVPVTRRAARDLHEVALTCAGPDAERIREAVTCGRLPVESAGLVARIFRRLRASVDYPDWDALAQIVVDWAASGASPGRLRAMEDAVLGQYGTATQLDEKHERQHRLREFSGFRPDRSGMLVATPRLDPASEAVVTAAIQALSAPAPVKDDRGDVVEADLRTPGQRRADAIVRLAGLATTPRVDVPGSGARARVTVTMTLADLVSGTGSASTALGQTLSPAEARTLACDAEIIPAVLGSAGDVLDLGRATRLVTPAQRAALHVRDRGCTYPGCGAPPGWCDGHHIRHWATFGPTDMTNLALLCRHHHTLVHRHGHTATVDDTGVRWRRSDGSPIGNTPRVRRLADR
ncbi:HNH endonuclease signature motif containing protein [Mobilicoccus massiliensis]|uniref:HNH endonuclease signature motif containing protein n=1 Tax=Mobilicoccus massiliensis TaxID=1522310 RepID=UPI0006949069|nr:HNH endonuclease signature motif containing protein [Mobilicoccus massiliensis]